MTYCYEYCFEIKISMILTVNKVNLFYVYNTTPPPPPPTQGYCIFTSKNQKSKNKITKAVSKNKEQSFKKIILKYTESYLKKKPLFYIPPFIVWPALKDPYKVEITNVSIIFKIIFSTLTHK